MTLDLHGIHHVSAITARIRENHAFYTNVMGMRLVKKSVNQDEPSMYHLFYADGHATPGTDLTFFDIPYAAREHRGTRSIIQTGLRVTSDESLTWWLNWLTEHNLKHEGIQTRDGKQVLDFEDPEGQRLSLSSDPDSEGVPWERSPIPLEHQIRGLGPMVISVPDLHATARVLEQVMNMRPIRQYMFSEGHQVHVFEMGDGGPGAELHVAVQPDAPVVRPGAGGVHHIAFRVPTFEAYNAWTQWLDENGIGNSGPVERYYFRSIYFREPNGILFELATDGPGFAVDEPLEALGEKLALPPFLEPRRTEIERKLKPL